MVEFRSVSTAEARSPRLSLTEQVGRDLLARIEGGTLQPGDRLPTERELMAQYGVSRTVIREAMSSLRAAGRLETQQGRGAFILGGPPPERGFQLNDVARATLDEVLALLEIRLALETEAAGLAAERHRPEQASELKALAESFAHAGDDPAAAAAQDRAFHLGIATLSGNGHFAPLLCGLSPHLLPRERIDLLQGDPHGQRAYHRRLEREHMRIVDAITRKDVEGSRAAMRAHLLSSRERLRQARAAPGDET